MVYEILVVGGIFFWIFVGLFALLITSSVRSSEFGTASSLLATLIVLLIVFTNFHTVLWSIDPMMALYGAGGYVILAAIWAIIKWRAFYLPKLFGKYEKYRSEWLRMKGLKEMPADASVRGDFNRFVKDRGVYINEQRMVGNNKARITGWMFFWPFSLVETFFGDIMARIFDHTYRMIASSLQGMSDRMAHRYSELDNED